MIIFSHLILFSLLKSLSYVSGTLIYPVHIKAPGSFIVTGPLIAHTPENATLLVALSAVSHEHNSGLSNASNPGILTDRMISASEFFKQRCDLFNPCILEGISDHRRIFAFGSTFLQLFEAAYPGLANVQISKEEIVELVLFACKRFAANPSNELHDEFLRKCLKIYFPGYFRYNQQKSSFQYFHLINAVHDMELVQVEECKSLTLSGIWNQLKASRDSIVMTLLYVIVISHFICVLTLTYNSLHKLN